MNNIDKSTLGLHLHNLMQRKLGHHHNWKMPEIQDTVGPYDPSVFRRYDERRVRIVNECQNKLAQYTDDQILILINHDMDDPDEVCNEWTGFLRDEIYNLEKRKPAWFAGGFGHPANQADFEYWGQMEGYTLHEALMLSVGVEPKHFSDKDLLKARGEGMRNNLLPSIEFLVRRYDLFFRKFPSNGFGKISVSPSFLADWFDQIELVVHPEFLEAVRRRKERARNPQGIRASSEPSSGPTKRTDRREIDTIAQLFVAMAIDSLGYDPDSKRSPIPKEIAELAASMGLEVSDDTVRKYLKLGAKFLPDDWKPG